MHLDGCEIGSKRILAEIEEHAFDDPPAAPRPSRPFTVSAEVRRPIAALESDTHELQLTVADIDQRLRRIPGRTFLLMTVLGMQALLALLIVYGDAIRPLRSEAHTSELQSLMRISYAVFCLKKTK